MGELTDCARCESAGSIEHGICQVCMARSPVMIVELPDPAVSPAPRERVVTLAAEPEGISVARSERDPAGARAV